ncbi:MAG: alpha/beta fold hydrolase [Pseudolabrys sp.]|jgi:3-oxoadipate enol-lactonase
MTTTVVEKIGAAPRIAVEHAGAGEAVIFMHGIGGNRRNWRDQIPAFSKYFKAIAWDARGYGDSDDYEGPLNFHSYADDVVRVLDHFGVERGTLVGLSMGGRIAMDFAARHADRLKTLVLCDTHKGFAGLSPEARTAFIASRKEPLVNGKEPKDIAGPVAKTLIGPNASKEAYEALVDSMSRLHKESYIKSIEASVNMDVRTDLDNIAVPTMVVVGSADRLTTVDMARSIASDIPGAELSIIEGAGHLVNIEEPEKFNSIVVDFLRRKLNG